MDYMSHLECPRCGHTQNPDVVTNLCEKCKSPLLVRYNLDAVKANWDRDSLKGRPSTLWRYRELLPVRDDAHIITLGEGMTPLFPIKKVGALIGLDDLWLKDEGILPTGTFKARGAAVGISRAKELGIGAVAMPTNGNAGGAWATYGARAGIAVGLCMPTDAPAMSVLEAFAVGAKAWKVKGLISDAGAIINKASAKYGWFEAATLKEPYRIEGKKTMGLEIAEQFGWEMPGAILYPTGGGVGLIGIYKALLELEALGWIKRPFPKLITVQPSGCAPIVKAFHEGKEVSEFWQNAQTVQQGTRVPKALGDFLVLQAVRATGGTAIAVQDPDALWGLRELARREGAFICPEGAALVAAARDLRTSGFLAKDERVVLLNTGAGIKYPDIMDPQMPVVEIGEEI